MSSDNFSRSRHPSPPWILPPLPQAVVDHNLFEVRRLIASDPNLATMVLQGGDQPLHLAAWENQPDIIRLLLEHGAGVNAAGEYGWTPLHYAAKYGSCDAALTLIDAGARLDEPDDSGRSPLVLAAVNCNPRSDDVAKILMERGATIDICASVCLGLADRAIMLLKADPAAIKNSKLRDHIIADSCLTMTYRAIEHHLSEEFEKSEDMMHRLVEYGARVGTALRLMVTHDTDGHMTAFLIALGADVNAPGTDGTLPLTAAREAGRQAAVKLLLQHGARE